MLTTLSLDLRATTCYPTVIKGDIHGGARE